jgi:hypothetical protein
MAVDVSHRCPTACCIILSLIMLCACDLDVRCGDSVFVEAYEALAGGMESGWP